MSAHMLTQTVVSIDSDACVEFVVVGVVVDINADTDTVIWDNEGAVEVGLKNMAGESITIMGEDGSLQGWRRGTCGRLHKGVTTCQ